MAQLMSIEEIKAQFDGEWILVEDPEVEENLLVKKGLVLWHGKDRDELNLKVRELPTPFNIAILYTGTTPDGVEIIL